MAVDVSAPLPQLDLRENTVITVELSDPGAVIQQFVVHGYQDVTTAPPRDLLPVTLLPSSQEA